MDTASEIDIQRVMQEIEEQLWSQRIWEQVPAIPSNLSDETRASLQRVRELATHLYVECAVNHSGLPLIGSVITWLRTRLHSLVLYYINDLAHREVMLALALLRVLNHISAENRQLQQEIVRLRQELYRTRTKDTKLGQYRLCSEKLRRRPHRWW